MKASEQSLFRVGIIGLSGVVFVMDLLFPLGIIVSVLYLPIVLASLRLPNRHRVVHSNRLFDA